MKANKYFKHKVNHNNLLGTCIYPREKAGFITYSLKTWVKPGIARIYAEEYVDEFYFDNTYVETRI